jgi:hypothetical protein
MAALFLFVLAVAGAVVVADLIWENPPTAEVTVFGQPVTGYPQGWLLVMAATLGFVVASLLVASVGATRAPGASPAAPRAAAGAPPAPGRAGGALDQRARPVVRPR